MDNNNQDFITSLQIWTVPQLKENKQPAVLTQDEPRNSDDDYMEYINQEVRELTSK